MPRGGYRGGGRPSLYQNQPTRTIRVPVVLADELVEIAKQLDSGKSPALQHSSETDARVIDILHDALKLKANAGGAIKQKIREALALLDE